MAAPPQLQRAGRPGTGAFAAGAAAAVPVVVGILPFGLLVGTAVSASRDVLAAWSGEPGRWFAAERVDLGDGVDFALVGCTVAPAFQFSDFELADAAALAGLASGHDTLLRRLSR